MSIVYRCPIRQDLYPPYSTAYRSRRNALHPPCSSPCHRNISASHDHAHPNVLSTVHVGTFYEQLCARTLPRLDFQNLTRTGGRADKGIDLLGQWLPPSLRHDKSQPLNVVVQCKAVARKAGPEMIRELEGALAGAPGEWSGGDTIGVLCAKRGVTAGVRDALRRSRRGIVWVMVEDIDDGGKECKREDREEVGVSDEEVKEDREAREGRIRQVLWNDRVQKLVGEETGTGVIYRLGEEGQPMESEVLMSWKGAIPSCDHK